ncbi:MAG: hypothetical protein ABSE20_15085 [Acetobacteraceae bacterium]
MPGMRPAFEDVLIFCPEYLNGGCEALHQLGHQIARHGGSAHMAYYGPYSGLELDGDVLRCHLAASPVPAYFARHKPRVLHEARLGPDTLLLFPEVLSALAATRDGRYRRALWWLSVDNAIEQNRALLDASYRQGVFADSGLLHFHQSDYARAFLEANAAVRYHALSDYTDPDFIDRSSNPTQNKPISQRANRICYFPNKGAALATRFIDGQEALRQSVEFLPIRGMTKAQVRDALFGARLYLDFGNHPGKDRVPREAAIAGAVVLLHAVGAALCFPDHPLPAEYRFTEDDIASGDLHRKVAAILDQPEAHFAAQRMYREAILHEQERFDLEVRSCFFSGL